VAASDVMRGVKEVVVLVEYADGETLTYEIPQPYSVTMKHEYNNPYYRDWYYLTTGHNVREVSFTVVPGSGSVFATMRRFEKKPGRRLMWGLRRLLGRTDD